MLTFRGEPRASSVRKERAITSRPSRQSGRQMHSSIASLGNRRMKAAAKRLNGAAATLCCRWGPGARRSSTATTLGDRCCSSGTSSSPRACSRITQQSARSRHECAHASATSQPVCVRACVRARRSASPHAVYLPGHRLAYMRRVAEETGVSEECKCLCGSRCLCGATWSEPEADTEVRWQCARLAYALRSLRCVGESVPSASRSGCHCPDIQATLLPGLWTRTPMGR